MQTLFKIDSELNELASRVETRRQLWTKFVNKVGVKAMVEVGVWKGDFAKEVLTRCESLKRYYMIDPWANLPDWNKPFNVEQRQFDDVYAEAMRKTAFASEKVVVLRGRTKEVIDEIPDESLDFGYIDGDHTLRGITIDLIKLLPKVREGGFIAGDDFVNTPWQHAASFEPTLVCPFSVYFAEAMNLPIVALPFQQFLIQKRSDVGFTFTDRVGKYGNLSLNRMLASAGMAWIKRTAGSALARAGLVKN